MSTRTDDFNRADESSGILSPWQSPIGGSAILILSSNHVQPISNGLHSPAYYGTVSWGDDQSSTIQITTAPSADIVAGPCVRMTSNSSGTYYYVQCQSTGTFLFRRVAGTFTQIGSTVTAISVNNYVKLDVVGTTLNVYFDTSNPPTTLRIGPITDANIASGSPGMSGFNNNPFHATMDNWTGTDTLGSFDASQFPHIPSPSMMDHARHYEVVVMGNGI